MARSLPETSMRDLLCRRKFPVRLKIQLMEVGKQDAGDASGKQLASPQYGQNDGPARNADVKGTNCNFVLNTERGDGQYTEEKKKGPKLGSLQKRGIRARTFPLSRAFSILPLIPDYLYPVVCALDFLYSGPVSSPDRLWQHAASSSACAVRAIRSLQNRIPSHQLSHDKPDTLPAGDWAVVTDVIPYIFRKDEDNSTRGDFRPLDAGRVDIPQDSSTSRAQTRFNWLSDLDASESFPLSYAGISFLTRPLLHTFGLKLEDGTIQASTPCESEALPRSRVYAIPGHFEKILHRAELAGMLRWTVVQTETSEMSMLADGITMTSFAVTKSEERDRLISWPRIQNLLFPPPPPVSLPYPSLFNRLRVTEKGNLSGFYLDIEVMFHNIMLPSHLIKFFPLSKVRFGNLPSKLQTHLAAIFGYWPHQSDFVRPYQSTLPMGFKWAVYVAHSISRSAIEAAVRTFKNLAPQIPKLKLGNISYATDTSGLLRINKGDALFLHIIDDVNFVADSWPRKAVVVLHQLVVGQFLKRQLPIKKAKSLPLQQVEEEVLPFIGWQWNLKTGLVTAQKSRLSLAISSVSALLTKNHHSPQDFESAVGRLIWQSFGHRPLLATLCSVFKLRYSRASFASLENLIKTTST